MIISKRARRGFAVWTVGLASIVSAAGGVPSVLPSEPGDNPSSCSNPGGSCGPGRYCIFDQDQDNSYCYHKSLVGNAISPRDVAILMLVGGCCFLAAMGGIGGGGLLLPLIVIVGNFSPREAVVLSHAGVFGNCLGQASYYVFGRKNLSGESSDVDNDLYRSVSATVLVILPGLLAGGSAAISLQRLVPSTAILVLALITLCFGTTKTCVKARHLWKQEEDSLAGQGSLMEIDDEVSQQGVSGRGEDSMQRGKTTQIANASINEAFAYEAMASSISEPGEEPNIDTLSRGSRESRSINSSHRMEVMGWSLVLRSFWTVESLIGLCWGLDALTFLVMKGSSSISKCSFAYTVLTLLPLGFGAFFTWRGRHLILWQIMQHERDENNFRSRERDFDVLIWWLPFVSFLVGLLSALLGIGGGEILGPTLLFFNMKPQHSSTTTSVIALLNSGTNTLHNFTSGLIISPGYFAAIWSIAFLSGASGRSFVMMLSSRTGKASIIAFSLAALLTSGAVLVCIELALTPVDWSNEGVCK